MAYRSRTSANGPLICVAPNWQLLRHDAAYAPNETVPSVFMDAILAAGGVPLMIPTTKLHRRSNNISQPGTAACLSY